jgi:N-acylneuraminate cytidylyltransferase
VIRHAIEQLDGGSGAVAFACCIYATAPFVRAEDIRQGLLMLQSRACEFVFSVTDFAYPIERALHLGPQGEVSMLRPQAYQTRSQDLEPAFHDAGQFYWGRAQAWIDERPVFGDGALGLRLPRHRVQDIDTPEDWIRAEWMFRAMRAAEGG